MKLFLPLYEKAIRWSRHRQAPKILCLLSFSESMFFPVPVDVMLAPMALAKPSSAWRFALIASLASVAGGIGGYFLGVFAYDSVIQPLVEQIGYTDKLNQAIEWFEIYGLWVIFLAGFSPIPYKVFTISAGFLSMPFLPFVLASLIGRSMRFFLVAGLMRWGGSAMESKLRQHIETLGWATVVLAIVAYLYLR